MLLIPPIFHWLSVRKARVLKNPNEIELARALGMVPIEERKRTYDVAVVGAEPAGLSTAVYAASEGHTAIVFDARAFGGQAGASARIEKLPRISRPVFRDRPSPAGPMSRPRNLGQLWQYPAK